jgi:hypothetical protein
MLRFLGTKIGLSLVIAVLIIGTATALKYRNSSQNSKITSKIDLIADASVQNAIKNGELDNSDWENTLKALTFGTTTEEIIKNLEDNATTTTTEENLTATDRFAREFFTKYVKLKESGAEIDESTGLRLVNELLANDYGGPAGEKIYTLADIRIINNATLADIKKYGNTLAEILDEPIPKGYENELIIANRVAETEENGDLKKLALNLARYEKLRDNIAMIYVPSGLKTNHIAMLNSLSKMIEGIRGMQLMVTDPVGATKMILEYDDGLNSLQLVVSQITAYFKKQNVIFSSTEPGYIFVE